MVKVVETVPPEGSARDRNGIGFSQLNRLAAEGAFILSGGEVPVWASVFPSRPHSDPQLCPALLGPTLLRVCLHFAHSFLSPDCLPQYRLHSGPWQSWERATAILGTSLSLSLWTFLCLGSRMLCFLTPSGNKHPSQGVSWGHA